MKKLILLSIFVYSSFSFAQGYHVTAFTAAYQDLTNTTSVNNGQVWDDPGFSVPIGFNFEHLGNNYNTLYFSENIGSGGVWSFHAENPSNFSNFSLIIAVGQDIIDRGITQSLSPISYKVEGSVGSRIFKLEFKNVGFIDDSTESDFMSFQIWLYEIDNSIEYRYGSNAINNPSESYEGETGLIVGYYPSLNIQGGAFNEDAYIMTGNPASPTVEVINPGSQPTGNTLNGNIPNGTVYRFEPQTVNTQNDVLTNFSVYPNPIQNQLYFENPNDEEIEYSFYDVQGKKIGVEKTTTYFDLSKLSSGIYFLKIRTLESSKTIKVIKH